MALPKSGKSGDNVTNLDVARNRRAKTSDPDDPGKTSAAEAKQATNESSTSEQLASSSDEGVKSDAQLPSPASKKRKVGNRRFDKVKVERIKAELAQGDYQINYLQVADKFIEHERYS